MHVRVLVVLAATLAAYPFVTVVAHELYDLGGRRECATDFDRALLWTGHVSRLPSLRLSWLTHRNGR